LPLRPGQALYCDRQHERELALARANKTGLNRICKSAWGPSADRRPKYLISFVSTGSMLGPIHTNLGRHLLGVSFLNCNKADGCAEYIRGQLPHINVSSRPLDARAILMSLSGADLIIDATGEEPFSIALNHHAVALRPNFPPILHTWIVGNGGAAQALLCDGPEQACFKCQKPKLAGEPRYRVMRPGSVNELRRNPARGDGLYAPFPVSASISAAARALDLVLAWNGGDPRHRFRTRVLDPDRSFQVKDTRMNLAPAPECPACRPRAR
jgi:hypothetical protein